MTLDVRSTVNAPQPPPKRDGKRAPTAKARTLARKQQRQVKAQRRNPR